MLRRVYKVLLEKWWGLLIGYGILFPFIFLGIWNFIEPVEIPQKWTAETIERLPWYFKSRIGLHVGLTILLTSHLLLLMEVFVRRRTWKISKVLYQSKYRVLDAFCGSLRNLRRELDREQKSPKRQNLDFFTKLVLDAFSQLRGKVGIFKEIAEGPLANEEKDEDCIRLLNNMEALQVEGDKLMSIIERASPDKKDYDEAIKALDEIFPKIEDMARTCRSIARF